jgi:NTE family protein
LRGKTPHFALYGRKEIASQADSKTALVLSSGGLFGAYQVGAWQYLAETSLQPDIVVGASVGALNGWAIAANADPAALAEQWLHERTSRILTMRQKPGILAGYFEAKPLRDFAEEVFAQYRPVLDFGLVIVELPFLRSRLIRRHAVTADHLTATASIPVAMPTVLIGGKMFTDGGLLEDVPLWAALEMGATKIVAIDAMHYEAPWWYRMGVSPMKMLAPRKPLGKKAQTLVIRPRTPLGPYNEAISWNRAKIKEWLERGYEDAERAVASCPFFGAELAAGFGRCMERDALEIATRVRGKAP